MDTSGSCSLRQELAVDYSHQARGESWDILLVCVSHLYFVNVCKITITIQCMNH